MFNLALDPCQKWPEIYFEKYDEPNSTLIDEMYQYGRKNLALVHVMIQSPYVIKIKRDVAMTFTTYIANSGGLLGLCLGFSLMSGIEIIFCICWFCGELNGHPLYFIGGHTFWDRVPTMPWRGQVC